MKIDLTGLEQVIYPRKNIDILYSFREVMKQQLARKMHQRKIELNRRYGKL